MLKIYVDYFRNLFRSKKGQGMVEYGLIIGLVAVLLIGALVAMRGQLQAIFQSITSALTPNSTSGT